MPKLRQVAALQRLRQIHFKLLATYIATIVRLSWAIALLTLIAVGVTNAQQPPATRPQRPAESAEKQLPPARAITGRVVADDGQPVSGASVLALPADLAGNKTTTLASMFSPAATDKDGQFEFKTLANGAYTLSAVMPGYVSETDARQQKYYRPGDRVTLTLTKGGVITGRVTNFRGDPVVGANVRAIRVRDAANRPVRASAGYNASMMFMTALLNNWHTDDRGIYRVYGLEPGTYHVSAGGRGMAPFPMSGGYDGDAPTYYPSGTADTAAEVVVRAGQEVGGIDIRYRDHRGYAVSGTVSGVAPSGPNPISVILTRASTGMTEAFTAVLPAAKSPAFQFDAVAEGEYYLTAYTNEAVEESAASRPRRVTVKGADLTGVELTLAPLGSIAGRVEVEAAQAEAPKSDCKGKRAIALEEIVIRALTNEKDKDAPPSPLGYYGAVAPGAKGEFKIKRLEPAPHHLDVELPGDDFYIRAITAPPATPAGKPVDAARNGIALKSGQHLTGIMVALSEGAAGLQGKVVAAQEGKALPARMRVHLVPAEPEAAENVLRYGEVVVSGDGTFALKSLAPGRYWLAARSIPDEESPEDDPRPLAWDAGGRAGLRFEGEALNVVVELKTCQRLADYVLRYSPPVPAAKPSPKKTGM